MLLEIGWAVHVVISHFHKCNYLPYYLYNYLIQYIQLSAAQYCCLIRLTSQDISNSNGYNHSHETNPGFILTVELYVTIVWGSFSLFHELITINHLDTFVWQSTHNTPVLPHLRLGGECGENGCWKIYESPSWIITNYLYCSGYQDESLVLSWLAQTVQMFKCWRRCHTLMGLVSPTPFCLNATCPSSFRNRVLRSLPPIVYVWLFQEMVHG